MIETATGIILRVRPLTESSLVVHWLTSELGRLSTVAKGARRPKSPFLGKLDLFYVADLSLSRSRRSELHTLREVSLRETHLGLRGDLALLRQACYGAALLEQTTETDTPLPGIFDLMRGLLTALPQSPPQPQLVFAFELKLLRELGLQPDLAQSGLSAGTKAVAKVLGEQTWAFSARVRLAAAQASELDHFLQRSLLAHLGRVPRSRAAALQAATGRP